MQNITALTDAFSAADMPDLTESQTVAVIESLFYQLYHVVAGEHGNPEQQCFAITSVHQDLIKIARGEL